MPIRAVVCTLLLLSSIAAISDPQIIVDTDFGAPGKSFTDIDAAKGNKITGSLPEGWSDNTGWKSKTVAEYRLVKESGRSFLRVAQTSGDGLQFTHALPGVEKQAGYYRISFTARSIVGGYPGIRFVGPPYTLVWSVTPAMDGTWRNYSFDLRLSPQTVALALFFFLSGNGVLDLQKIKMVRLSDQDLIEEIKAKYPDAGSGNLIRITRFPLGMQSGWSIDRDYSDGDQVRVEGDPAIVGPSGSPALKISAPHGILIYSAPFAARWSFDRHVASLSVRGSFDGRLQVAGGKGDWCGEIPLKVDSSDWRRVEFTFKPILLASCHHLRIEGKGTLWIDSLQVEHALKAGAYAPRMPVEVSLALPTSEASSARVIFDGEPHKVKYAVTGQHAGALLKSRLVTLYGDHVSLPAVKMKQGYLNTGTLSFTAINRHPYGTYRLEAWVEDPTGKRLSDVNEVVFHRLHRPRYWTKDAPNSFFGVHTLSANRQLTMAKAVGCNWVRLHDAGTTYIGWSFLEPEKGKWQFRDADIQRYRNHHLKILGLLSTSPGWASNLGRPCTGYFDRYLEPLNMADWANAVRTIVGHYRGVIDSYEIWNEPWGDSFWSLKLDDTKSGDESLRLVRSPTASEDYTRLQKTAYAAAHDVYPQAAIVGFNTYGAETGTKWTKDVLDFGGLEACDAISYHHYETSITGFPGDGTEKAYRAAVSPIIDKLGSVPKPVWMSEGAPLSGDPSNGFYHYTLPYENGDDNWRIADRLARFIISRHSTGEKRAFLYTMHGFSTFGGQMDWSTLITADGYLHPSAAAHSALAWLLEDTRYVKRVALANGVYAYLFAGKDRAVAALTTGPKRSAYRFPSAKDLHILDLFGNPVSPGSLMDDHVHYITCNGGLAKLEARLK